MPYVTHGTTLLYAEYVLRVIKKQDKFCSGMLGGDAHNTNYPNTRAVW